MLAKTIVIALLPIFVAAQTDATTSTDVSTSSVVATTTDLAISTDVATSSSITTATDAPTTTDPATNSTSPVPLSTDGGDYNTDVAPTISLVAAPAWPTNTLVTAPAGPPCNSTGYFGGGSPTQSGTRAAQQSSNAAAGADMPKEAYIALLGALAGTFLL